MVYGFWEAQACEERAARAYREIDMAAYGLIDNGQMTAAGMKTLGQNVGVSVQERIASTLTNLTQAHDMLDSLEGDAKAEPSNGLPPLGLIGGAHECEEQSDRLLRRVASLRDRLGNL